MLQEDKFLIENFKGKIEFSKERIMHIIQSIADYTIKFTVKKVDINFIEKFNKWVFIIHLQNNYNINFFNVAFANYKMHLSKQIESNINISNFILTLFFH